MKDAANGRPKTLVGRMALVQLAVAIVALSAMVALSFAAVTFAMTRRWDEGLRAVSERAAKRLRTFTTKPRDLGWLSDELEEHRPLGVRIEIQTEAGRILAADGKGPPLVARGPGCRDQALYRVCEVAAPGHRILAATSRASGLRDRRMFAGASAAVAAFLALVIALVTRRIARRTLAALPRMAERIGGLRPGTNDRVGLAAPFAELRTLEESFDQLLARVDEALARERRLSAEASHELRTPLTVARAEIESVLAHAPAGETEESARRALGAIDRLVGLVEALLWFSRAEAPFDPRSLDVVNLADLARQQALLVGERHGRQVEVEAPDELLARGNEALVERVLANLLENAWKHTPADARIAVRCVELRGAAQVTVEDSGPGVPAEQRERIFEPFFRGGRARAATPGFGLGLPLARAIARAHGGDLALEPSTPRGSRFVLRLPVPS